MSKRMDSNSCPIEPGDMVHCRSRSGCYQVLALQTGGTAMLQPIDESWVKKIYCPLEQLTPAQPD